MPLPSSLSRLTGNSPAMLTIPERPQARARAGKVAAQAMPKPQQMMNSNKPGPSIFGQPGGSIAQGKQPMLGKPGGLPLPGNHPARNLGDALRASNNDNTPALPTGFDEKRTVEGNDKPLSFDSGIGGVMASISTRGDVKHVAADVCLPIGDKDTQQRITFTAQMVLQGLVAEGHNNVIIACNTASTAADEAIAMSAFWMRQQVESPETADIATDSYEMERIQHLVGLMDAAGGAVDEMAGQEMPASLCRQSDHAVLSQMVHEIVTPTSGRAADAAMEALFNEDDGPAQNDFRIVVDSTVGTVKSEAYLTRIFDQIETQMADRGYTFQPESGGIGGGEDRPNLFYQKADYSEETSAALKDAGLYPADKPVPPMEVASLSATFVPTSGEGEAKTVEVHNRGNPAWVPVIEGGPENAAELRQMMAVDAHNATDDMPGFEQRTPDFQMMCCTHYPAMVGDMESVYQEASGDWGGETLTQMNVVEEMAATMGQDEDTGEGKRMDIKRGMPSMTDALRQQTIDTIRGVGVGPDRVFSVESMKPQEFDTFQAMHKGVEFAWEANDPRTAVAGSNVPGGEVEWQVNQSGDGYELKPDKDARSEETQKPSMKMLWQRNFDDPVPAKRSTPVLKDISTTFDADTFIETNRAKMDEAGGRLEGLGITGDRLEALSSKLTNIANLITQGESRGVDVLAARHSPVPDMMSAAARIAEAITANAGKSDAELTPIGIVTGFTVVDANNDPINGENDGPPGAIVMAKQIIDSGTPVQLVCDSGSLESVKAAAAAIGLVQEDGSLDPGLEILFSNHGTKTDGPQPAGVIEFDSVDDINDTMRSGSGKPTPDLMISIERPSVSAEGNMSSMSAQDISRYNADLSPFFETSAAERPWATVGIGDGGNEIGMGKVAETTRNFRTPAYSLAVNNGDKIAAAVKTDDLVMGSVSNNAGVALATATNLVLESAMDAKGEKPSGPVGGEKARETVESYRTVITNMFENGISIDGVNKVNAMTVDGRTLNRADGENPGPKDLGTREATHDDLFDELVKLAGS